MDDAVALSIGRSGDRAIDESMTPAITRWPDHPITRSTP
jgi:hypothetical protein